MAKPTLEELIDRSKRAIERKEILVFDVASESGSIVGNVAHMRWFICAVADALVATTDKWSGLQKELNTYRNSS